MGMRLHNMEMSVQLVHSMVKGVFGFLPDREAIQYCPQYIDGECECRKPAVGIIISGTGVSFLKTMHLMAMQQHSGD